MITLATLTLIITYIVAVQNFRADVKEIKEDTEKLILLLEFRRLLRKQEQTESNIKFITLEKEEKDNMKTVNLKSYENRIEIILAVENVKAGKNIQKTDEIKGYSIIDNAINRLKERLNIEEKEAIEIVKFCIKENYTDTEIRLGKKIQKEEEKKDMKLNIQLFAKKNVALEKLKEAVERKGLKKITEEITILSAEEIAKKHELELNNELLDYLTDLMHVEGSKQIYLERLTVENYLLKQVKPAVKKATKKVVEKVPTEKDDLLLQNKIHFEKEAKYDYPKIEITDKDFDNLVESFKFSSTEKDNWSCGKVEIFKGKITSTDTYALIQYNISTYSEEKFYITTDVFKKIYSDLKKFSNKKVTIFKVNEENFVISWNNRSVKYRLLTTHFVNYPMLIESINNFGEELEFSPELKDKIDLIKIDNKKYKENTIILDTENKIVKGADKDKEYKIDYIATKQIKVGMNQDYLSFALKLTNKCNYKNNNSMFIFKKDNTTFMFCPKVLRD